MVVEIAIDTSFDDNFNPCDIDLDVEFRVSLLLHDGYTEDDVGENNY